MVQELPMGSWLLLLNPEVRQETRKEPKSHLPARLPWKKSLTCPNIKTNMVPGPIFNFLPHPMVHGVLLSDQAIRWGWTLYQISPLTRTLTLNCSRHREELLSRRIPIT